LRKTSTGAQSSFLAVRHEPAIGEKILMRLLTKTLAIAALATAVILAQPPAPPDPATMIQNRVDHLTAALGLTTAQAAQATTIFTNAQTAISPLQTSLDQARQNLQTAIKGNASGSIDALSATIGTISGQILAAQSKGDAAFYAILTADQQAKLDSMPPGPGRGPGGPGPGGLGPNGIGMGRGRRQ
jgi:Spy/CpxP family protein refolding chaperone